MSSRQKRKVARQNGAKATGPKPPVSIPQSAASPSQPSLLVKTLVLANESHDRCEKLYQSYIDRFKPADEVEMGFVNEMVAARWRQQRLWMLQTAGMNLEMDRQQQPIEETMLHCSEQTRVSLAFDGLAKLDKTLELQLRYETAYSRMHDRAMKALKRLQQDRIQQEGIDKPEVRRETEPACLMETTTEPASEPEIATTSAPAELENEKLRNDAKPQPTPLVQLPDQASPESPQPRDNVFTEI
jgi:hypothetical protein